MLSAEVVNISLNAIKLFPQLVENVEQLNTEWTLISDTNELKHLQDCTLKDFWLNIFL